MGLLNFLGLDELADSVRELTDGIDELKQDIVASVIEPTEELKNTVNKIAGSVIDGPASIIDAVDTEATE